MLSQKSLRRFIVHQNSNRCHKSFKKPDGSDVHHSNHLVDFKTMKCTVIACVVVVLLASVSVDAVARRTLFDTLTLKTNKRFVINYECIFIC